MNRFSDQGRNVKKTLNDWSSDLIPDYTRRQINLYRMFFADFSGNSQPILMTFRKDNFREKKTKNIL